MPTTTVLPVRNYLMAPAQIALLLQIVDARTRRKVNVAAVAANGLLELGVSVGRILKTKHHQI